jgi:hypothetical protein
MWPSFAPTKRGSPARGLLRDWFFLREARTLKQFGRNAEAARHRRTDQPSSGNKNVHHESAGCLFVLARPQYSLHRASRDAIY